MDFGNTVRFRAPFTCGSWFLAAVSLCAPLLGCTSGQPHNQTVDGGKRKPPSPSPPTVPHKPPTGAVEQGKKPTVTPPGNGGRSLEVPGGGESEVYAWKMAIDDSGGLADCEGAFTSQGSVAIACAPYLDTCEDGSKLEAALFIFYDASQEAGGFALVGSNLCGGGYDIYACTLDSEAEIGSCGAGTFNGDHIDVQPST